MAFRRWFPRSLQEQALFFSVFTKIFKENAALLGFTAADIERLEKDNAVMQYLAETESALKFYKKAFQSLRDELTGGQSVVQPQYMTYHEPEQPPIVPFGMFNRLFHLADRIEAADKYTTAIGAALNILPPAAEPLRASDVRLTFKARPIREAHVEVVFVRGRTSGARLYMQRIGSDEWIDLGRYVYSPAIIEIPLLEAGKAEQIRLRGRHLKNNDAFGEYSNIVTVVVAP